MPKIVENRDQVDAEGRKWATSRVTNLPHEGQAAFIAESPTTSALWHVSLVLREIAENLQQHGDEKQPLRLVPGKDTVTASDEECDDEQKRHI